MSTKLRPSFALFLILLVFTPASATVAAGPPNDDQKSTTISGQVLGLDGRPAVDAEVKLPYGEKPITTRTDAEGRFSLEVKARIVPGAPLLAIGRDGALGQIALPNKYDAEAAAPLDAQRIELKTPRVIDVTVNDAAGKPVSGAEVVVMADYRTAATATTDDAGRVTLQVSPDAGLQFVLATKAEVGVDYLLYRNPRVPASDPYQLPPGHADPLTFQLQPSRTIEVRAVDHKGRPVAGAEVHPWLISLAKKGDSANLGLLWSQKTDADGTARFPHIPVNNEGTVTFWVRKDGLIASERTNLEKGDKTTAKLTATLLPLVPVKGRVAYADGSPAADMTVMAAGDGHEFDDYREQTKTDADGRFELAVYPDHYCLFAAGDREHASPAVARVVRMGQPIDDLELELGPATRIHGRLTVGATDKPAAEQYVQLYQKDVPGYYDLPEDQRLPNPKDSNFAVVPRVVRSTQTDADGRFEFFAGPGEYYIIGNQLEDDGPQFTIENEPEREFNLAVKGALDGKVTGRVVLASNPDRGVPELRVFSYPEDMRGNHISATTDAEGRFEARPPGSASLVGAFSEDKTIGAIIRIEADQTEFTLELAPTASAHGTLIDEETGSPAAGRRIGAAIRVGPESGPFMSAFEQSAKTDDSGVFEIRGLVPGHAYNVHVVTEQDADGNARSWRNVGKAEPASAGELPLGELRIPKPYRPPTVDDDIARAYSHKDAAKRLKRLLADAKLAYGQVLVVAGSPDEKATRRYFEICWHNSMGPRNELTPPNLHEYMVLAVDPKKAGDFFKSNDLAPPDAHGLALAILNPDSSVVAQTTAADLSKDGKLDAKLLSEFLANRRAPLPSARRLLDEALAEAARDDKRVLVQVGGPGCGWCVVLARYLEEQKDLVSKDYIHLKLDSRMPEAEAVIGELRKNQEGGIPWMIILAADGQPLITSEGEEGNIGYPGEPESRDHWEKMLRETRQRLTDEDLAALLKPLEKSP